MSRLTHLEEWIEKLVEEPFVRLFAGPLLPQDVATQLVQAIEAGEQESGNGRREASTRYQITLHPQTLAHLESKHPEFQSELANELKKLFRHLQLRPSPPPQISLQADSAVPPGAVRITPGAGRTAEEKRTRELAPSRLDQLPEDGLPPTNAYLLLPDDRQFQLTQPQIRIGRALDNDLILEKSCISRHHARLQELPGGHLIEDLNSRGGTTINGYPILKSYLSAGDYISFAGIKIQYIQPETDKLNQG